MEKRFIRIFAVTLVLLLGLYAGVVAVIDPMYHYHPPILGLPLHLDDGRYQNASTARNFDYDTVIMGTSISANASASQVEALFGGKAIKMIVLDGYFSDFSAALDIALETHAVKRVIWGIDSNILARSESGRTVDLPEYLYNRNPFDDVQYLFNKDLLSDMGEILAGWRRHQAPTMDDAFAWEARGWSKQHALAGYPRPQSFAPAAPPDSLLDNAREGLAVLEGYARDNPQVDFQLYMAPYSILFWDKTARSGLLDATLEMHRTVMEALCALPNVSLYYFLDEYSLITDLDHYADHIHFSPDINRWVFDTMAAREPVKAEDIGPRLAALRSFIIGYDFEAIFAQE